MLYKMLLFILPTVSHIYTQKQLLKETQVFSCEFWEIFKNTFFIEYLWWLLLTVLERTKRY